MMKISGARHQKYIQVANKRQSDWTVILENVSDWHNIGAVMRTCDAVGIGDMYVVYSDLDYRPDKIGLGKRTTAGSRKWFQVHYFEDLEACFELVRQQYGRIFTTYLEDGQTSRSVYELDLVQPGAYLFGNESDGVSEQAARMSDENFIIPQQGMVGSLNISVACAVTLFEGMRQRLEAGRYPQSEELLSHGKPYYEKYMEVHQKKLKRLEILEGK